MNFREAELHGAIGRGAYTYGMLRAADVANYFGTREITVIEFGVGDGGGLLEMARAAKFVEQETGVQLHVVGFDTGTGLPAPYSYKDHPEMWSVGDFPTGVHVPSAVEMGAKMIWGEIADTGPRFFAGSALDTAPLGFAAIDVDLYSSAVSVLQGFLEPRASKFTPAVSLYFDDTTSFFSNEWCGELAAISEFNAASAERKISVDRTFPGHRTAAYRWFSGMRVLHVLDHKYRQISRLRSALSTSEHHKLLSRLSC